MRRTLFALALSGILFVVILLIDDPLNPVASEDLQSNTTAPDTAGNGYVYLLGFAANPLSDPLKVGAFRLDGYRQALEDQQLAQYQDYAPALRMKGPDFSNWCNLQDAACIDTTVARREGIMALARKYALLLQRLETLYSYPELRSLVRPGASEPQPDYQLLLRAAHLNRLHLLARHGEDTAQIARDALLQRIRISRRHLAAADTLYMKIAFASLVRADLHALQALQRIDPRMRLPELPPLDAPERSLARPLQREFLGIAHDLDLLMKTPELRDALPAEARNNLRFLFQRNMTLHGLHAWYRAALTGNGIPGADLRTVIRSDCRFCLRNAGGFRLLQALLPDSARTTAQLRELTRQIALYNPQREPGDSN